ncbi:haloacid dehalogenase superfamily, subfamily IA, variant 3 with third motif having DD or ED/beta-phosphoglucomutase family hydrolase [Actinomadura meyerae]|uniref:Beta-phosphoglucomutase n=1 Tax=Actinomadura meyerae TaxID=240840 RepID=A0A239MX92_9ACTN|nr:beta-phosphoglucomutase family hydrolase [Actinomadura meyerae]SNT47371.1 haloacid dehalogenase superfamily, subfamily IA, variant 3 with third motif having DD or ED/beta-phosphoglucomutase family hydrolase [Actinomadura meyerae]
MLGLPDDATACLFDLDGVLTRTASVHAAAWKEMFDGYLRERSERTGEAFIEFDPVHDYGRYVDGKKREDGTRSFLESRGIVLPEGDPGDPPEKETVRGLGNRKNALVLKIIEEKGVETFDGSIDYVRAAREAGLRTAVVSSSANTVQVLATVGITDLFDARVDGVIAAERHLPGKPAPDMFLLGAKELGVPASRAVVFEDALAGVQAGRAGGFAYVVGVNRVSEAHAKALAEHGADVVVDDLSELLEDV